MPKSLKAVDDAIRQKFESEGFKGELEYDPARIVETDHWWYVPCGWIGCSGCIVNKDNFYVNWLGSALSQDMYIWGHEHGIFHDLVDFTFAPDTDLALVNELLPRFKHKRPDANGVKPTEPVWYRTSEIGPALSSQFPTFRRHFVWYAIPEIRDAYEHDALRFTSILSTVV